MALTLAQRNQLRKRAAQEAAATAPAALMDGLTSYELMLAKLQQDQLRLKQVQSQQNKAKVKAELLPDYAPTSRASSPPAREPKTTLWPT